jgi:hypothetical protein
MPSLEAAEGKDVRRTRIDLGDARQKKKSQLISQSRESWDAEHPHKKAPDKALEVEHLDPYEEVFLLLATLQINKAKELYKKIDVFLSLFHIKELLTCVEEVRNKIEFTYEILLPEDEELAELGSLEEFIDSLQELSDEFLEYGDNEHTSITTPEERFRNLIARGNEAKAQYVLEINKFNLSTLYTLFHFVKNNIKNVEHSKGKYLTDEAYLRKMEELPIILRQITQLIEQKSAGESSQIKFVEVPIRSIKLEREGEQKERKVAWEKREEGVL